MKNYIILLLMLIASKTSFSQVISVGELLPKQTLDSIQLLDGNYIPSSEFENKYIIFEFWSTWCSTCVKNMPKIQDIKGEFADSLTLFLVNNQKEELVRGFWNSNAVTQSLKMSTIVGNSKLKEHFPYKGVPYVVWVGPDLTVKHLTNGRYLTKENVQLFLKGQPLQLSK